MRLTVGAMLIKDGSVMFVTIKLKPIKQNLIPN